MPPRGIAQSDWDEAKGEAHSAMVRAVQSTAGTISYGDLAAKIRTIPFEPDTRNFHALLGEISEEENALGRGMLSVVVVHKSGEKRGQPGDGFFKLAHELGRDTHDPLRFWATEFAHVRRSWPRNGGIQREAGQSQAADHGVERNKCPRH
jgi:hypothetical protein